MPIIGTLDEIAAVAQGEVDRARIHGYEALSVSAGPYDVVLFFNRDAIIGEAVSNVVLAPEDALSREQQDRLVSLGWARPDDLFHPRFHRAWSREAASGTIVRDLLTAFICVAELEEGAEVACERDAWCGAPGSGYPCDHLTDGREVSPRSGDAGPSAA